MLFCGGGIVVVEVGVVLVVCLIVVLFVKVILNFVVLGMLLYSGVVILFIFGLWV